MRAQVNTIVWRTVDLFINPLTSCCPATVAPPGARVALKPRGSACRRCRIRQHKQFRSLALETLPRGWPAARRTYVVTQFLPLQSTPLIWVSFSNKLRIHWHLDFLYLVNSVSARTISNFGHSAVPAVGKSD
jgi:hypothetical protein